MTSQPLTAALKPKPPRYFLLQVVLVALLYFATGKLGLFLATDNDYSTLIWPPSGIALGAILLLGYRIWPAIALGAFATNVSFSIESMTLIDILTTQPQNYVIALGNTAQPLLAAYLLRRFKSYPNPLTQIGKIVQFYLIAGPLACLVAASVGAASLYGFGVIPAADIFNTWGTWWIGDTNGVILITPLIIAWGLPRDNAWVLRRVAVTAGLLLVLLMLTIFVYHSRKWNDDELQKRVAFETDTIARALQDEVANAVTTVYGLSGVMALAPGIRFDEFQSYARILLDRAPGLSGLSWNPHITDTDRAWHEARLSRDYGGDRTITERGSDGGLKTAAQAEEYVYVHFLEPLAGSENAVGFNIWSNEARRASINKAREINSAVITPRISLVQGTYGALILLPVKNGEVVTGYATGVIRIAHIVEKAMVAASARGLYINLDDPEAEVSRKELYDGFPLQAPSWDKTREKLTHRADIKAADRTWQLSVTPTDSYVFAYRSKTSWLVMLAVWTSAATLGVLFLVLTGRHFETERLVAERTEELILANRAKTDFLANMSHEIRTPMNGVLGMLNLLDDGNLSTEQKDLVVVARKSAKSLLVVINDILDFSKLQKGEVRFNAEPIELEPVVADTVQLLRPTADEKGLQLNFHSYSKQNLPVEFDQARLQQILFNIIGNAIKFTDAGKVDVDITVTAQRFNKAAAIIEVRDTGIGIDPKDQKRIFDRFVQVDGSSSRRYQGSGLGLAISRQLVEHLGGTLSLESTLGEGTLVTIHLPNLVRCERDRRSPKAEAPKATPPQTALKVLVAEDNMVNQMIVQKLLTRHGHSAIMASNGAEAVTTLEHMVAEGAPLPDLVLMDIQMPEVDGVEATKRIRASDGPIANIPIIALTANALPEQHASYLAAGMNNCVNKPIEFGKFYSVIADVLGLKVADLAERRKA
ncbi:ATP-binding protein [Kordiimonas sp.]|uniref:ATP-binding protein n=1 Tax=Kordiimonas sp. TaxID=1970157 RepID=UPI003A8D515C